MNITIKLVVPIENYIKQAVNFFEQHEFAMNQNYINEKITYDFEEKVIPTNEISDTEIVADVIVSRGILTKKLKEIYDDIPIVDIPVQGIDLIQCLQQCAEKYHPHKVAVIGTSNMIYGVDHFETLLQFKIEEYTINDINEVEQIVDDAAANGCEVIVGGLSTHRAAIARDIPSIIIETSEESLNQAYNEAKRIALVSRKEQERTRQYQTILDHAYEGIIAINSHGKISAFNHTAKKILNLKERDLINKNIKDVLVPDDFTNFITNKEKYGEKITTYQSTHLSANKQPVNLHGKHIGKVIAFQDVTGIQDLEGKIRKKMYLRGHIAKHHFEDIVHRSQVAADTIKMAKKFSKANSNILIIGETGAGKEMYAQSLHNYSERRDKPFVAINCAALPENLLESELFGYVDGAFTGATKGGKKGIFELAHQGTLFLDEIGEISLHLQSRLLRATQEKEVMRIGDDRVIPIDVRIISATNRDLLEMVENNEFREDLYYRLCVLELYLPSLRESWEDIPALIKHFISHYSKSNQNITFTDAAMEEIIQMDWPGNIRQLQNFCERVTVLCKNGIIDKSDLQQYLPRSLIQKQDDSTITNINSNDLNKKDEEEKIMLALKKAKYNREKAAQILNISRTTLWRKMRAMNIVEK